VHHYEIFDCVRSSDAINGVHMQLLCFALHQCQSQYPRLATYVLLPLKYEDEYSVAEIVIFGGSFNTSCKFGAPDAAQIDSRNMYKVSITIEMADEEPAYTFSEWEEDSMIIPRSGGDATILPNGV
jgi:hypothetical protein